MAKPKLNLYVDIVSPFGYLAYWMTRNSPLFKQVETTYTPILLGGLMNACDNRAPIEIRNKGTWINVERQRWQRLFHVPMVEHPPPGFPPRTLSTQRALCALQISHPAEKLAEALDALYHSFWVEGNADIGKPEGFGPVLTRVLGEADAKDVMQRLASPEAKKRLTENTDRAFADGAFGIPWWECTDAQGRTESFWGFDHLGQVVRFLGLDDEVLREEIKRTDAAGKDAGAGGMRAML